MFILSPLTKYIYTEGPIPYNTKYDQTNKWINTFTHIRQRKMLFIYG